MSESNKKTFFDEMMDRRFFPYLATYIGVSWGLLQFLIFAVPRYGWDSSVIDRFLMFSAILLPVVCIFIYNHGKPGPDKWLSYEKWLVPLSVVVALGSATFFINSDVPEDSEPDSSTITFTSDDGETLSRQVPNVRYSKRLVLFPLENKSGQKDLEWLRIGFSVLLDNDLEQDMRVASSSPLGLNYEYGDYKHTLEDDISTGTKIKISRDNYSDYYVDGSFDFMDDKYEVQFDVKNAKDGKDFFSKTYNATDIYAIVDNFSKDLSENLFSKEFFEDRDLTDLPINELISSKPKVVEKYIESNILANRTETHSEALKEIEEALVMDESCAPCFFTKSMLLNGMQRREESLAAMDQALDISQSLPERSRMDLRWYAYQLNQNMDKAIRLAETWSKLYPHDQRPYDRLFSLFSMLQDKARSMDVVQAAIDNGHKGKFLTRIADLHIDKEEFDEAEQYLSEFKDLYPSKSKESSLLAKILIKQGKLKEAIEFYDEQEIVNGETSQLAMQKANVYDKIGAFDKAEDELNRALKLCKQIPDSLQVMATMRLHNIAQGKVSRSMEIYAESEALAKKIMPEITVNATYFLGSSGEYMFVDRIPEWKEEGYRRFPGDDMQSSLMRSFIDHFSAIYTGDLELYQASRPKVEPILKSTIGEAYSIYTDGVEHKMQGNYDDAISKFKEYLDLTDGDYSQMYDMLTQSYLLNGEPDKCVEYVQKILKSDPSNQTYLWEAIQGYDALGDKNRVEEYVERLDKVLINADPDFTTKVKLEKFKSEQLPT